MNERMIFKDKIYRFEFLDNSREEMIALNITFNDIKDAFLKIEDQREFFESVSNSATFVFDDLYYNKIIGKINDNLIMIIKVI